MFASIKSFMWAVDGEWEDSDAESGGYPSKQVPLWGSLNISFHVVGKVLFRFNKKIPIVGLKKINFSKNYYIFSKGIPLSSKLIVPLNKDVYIKSKILKEFKMSSEIVSVLEIPYYINFDIVSNISNKISKIAEIVNFYYN